MQCIISKSHNQSKVFHSLSIHSNPSNYIRLGIVRADDDAPWLNIDGTLVPDTALWLQ